MSAVEDRGPGRALLYLAALIGVPLVLGLVVVGPEPPAGRTSRSPTRIGHKAVALLIERLGYRVRRFERGVERLPPGGGVLVALEPGPLLLREGGRYARSILDWVAEGRGALVSLGPDPDRDAELDDRADLFGARAEQAIGTAKALERAARDRAEPAERAGQPDGAPHRAPSARRPPEESSASWSVQHLASWLGAGIDERRLTAVTPAAPCRLEGPLAVGLGDRPEVVLTRPRAFSLTGTVGGGPRLETLLSMCGAPVLVSAAIGGGEILLLSEPRLLQNGRLRSGAHARLAIRMIERLAARSGSDAVYFEEFSHGGREAANTLDLILSTRARRPFAQLLLVALVGILAVAAARRTAVPFEETPRRSRGEVVEAMVTLHLRCGDLIGAGERLVALTRSRLSRELGLGPPVSSGSADPLAALVAQRTGRSEAEVRGLLDPAGLDAEGALIARAEALRILRAGTKRSQPGSMPRS